MAIQDFMAPTAVVVYGGERYVVKQPTHRTVHYFLGMYAREVMLLTKTWASDTTFLGDNPIALCLPRFVDDGNKAATVLATCCTLFEGAPGQLEEQIAADKKLRTKLAMAMLGLCDLERVVLAMNLGKFSTGDESTPESEGADFSAEQSMIALAALLHITLEETTDLPFELMLSLAEALKAKANEEGTPPPTSFDGATTVPSGHAMDRLRKYRPHTE